MQSVPSWDIDFKYKLYYRPLIFFFFFFFFGGGIFTTRTCADACLNKTKST